MSPALPPRLQAAVAGARRRRAVAAVAIGLPLAGLAALLAWRLHGDAAALAAGLAALLAVAGLAAVQARRLRPASLAARLNARLPAMQDSADLLLSPPATPSPLQALQQQRLRQALAAAPVPDLRAPWPRRVIGLAWLGAVLLGAAVALWPSPAARPAAPAVPSADAAVDAPLALASVRLGVSPPAYTGLPAQSLATLSASAPVRSRLRWQLRFDGEVGAVRLRFHDGSELALQPGDGDWTGERALERSTLYRIEVDAAGAFEDARLHRLDARPDQPPQLRVIEPARSLSLHAPGQATWPLVFEASDDHGLGPARLRITLAQGAGEQVSVREQLRPLTGEGDARQRRYAVRLDLAALGLAEGDDLIVRLELEDNRAPVPQPGRSASLILRWPLPPAAEATGLDGLVRQTLPAYFRSQRQIIIDAEALLAERPRLDADTFLGRSDALAVDQRILRLRYGEFLGEESEGEPAPPPDGVDDGHGDEDHAHADEGAAFAAADLLERFGHTHDEAEAATLLDPRTRGLLRQALDAMWRSEGELRQGRPGQALPHAYRALGFIKQVQQASRIYLARVGLELPPIDASRRMGGKRDGLRSRPDPLPVADATPAPLPALWAALAPGAAPDGALLTAAEDWVRGNEDAVADALGLLAAIDALRREPGCEDCRQALRRQLWPALPAPTPAPAARPAGDEAGAAYLEALSAGAAAGATP